MIVAHLPTRCLDGARFLAVSLLGSAMVSTRAIAEGGNPSRRASNSSALPRMPVSGLFTSWRRISPKSSSKPKPSGTNSSATETAKCIRRSTRPAGNSHGIGALRATKNAAPEVIERRRSSGLPLGCGLTTTMGAHSVSMAGQWIRER